jgi:hypothetical protein
LLQQSLACVHACPYCAQTPPSGTPASHDGGGGGGGAQVPDVDPGGTWQMLPAQQSAVTVQLPPDGMHTGPPPSRPIAQRSCPVLSRTHGTPLQQSPEKAHVSPPGLQSPPPQRGTPKRSSWQTPDLLPTPLQQLAGADETTHA